MALLPASGLPTFRRDWFAAILLAQIYRLPFQIFTLALSFVPDRNNLRLLPGPALYLLKEFLPIGRPASVLAREGRRCLFSGRRGGSCSFPALPLGADRVKGGSND